MTFKAGDTIDGKYRIVRLLGEGGMGAVYEGENTRINRRVAIKVLHASVAAKEHVVRRFEQEARAAGLIGSEHIVEVLDLGNLPTGERYMVMEFLEGQDLGARIKQQKRLSPREATPIIYQLLDGLAAAHKAGIIHRDLKPDNVFLVTSRAGQRDFVKVLDFGVSKFSALESEEMNMTSTGAVMGTPFYLSPEQARGLKNLDGRSDLYSVGVVLYQSVTGRLPFHAETFNELVFKIALEAPDPAETVVPGLDPAFAAIIAKSMMRDPNSRFQSAQEFQAALAQWLLANSSPDAPSMPGGIPGAQVPSSVLGGTAALPLSAPPMHASTPGTPAPGAPGYSAPQLAASQSGVALATPAPKKKSGALIAVALAGLFVIAGGALGFFMIKNRRESGSPEPTPTTTASAAPSATASAEPVTPPVTPLSTATASAAPSDTALPAVSSGPVASAPPAGSWQPRPPTTGAGTASLPTGSVRKSGAPTGTVTTPPPRSTGRVIGGEL